VHDGIGTTSGAQFSGLFASDAMMAGEEIRRIVLAFDFEPGARQHSRTRLGRPSPCAVVAMPPLNE
jgi:hypothetical protein